MSAAPQKPRTPPLSPVEGFLRLRRRARWALGLTAVFLAAALIYGAGVGAVDIGYAQVAGLLVQGCPAELSGGDGAGPQAFIVCRVRLPRLVLAALVGACLAAAGAVFQGIFLNPLADPYLIGVSAGASLGATLAILFGASLPLIAGPWAVPASAFAGALGALALVYALARERGGELVPENLILAGIIVGATLSAFISFLKSIAGENLSDVVFWIMGSFAGRTWQHVALFAAYALPTTALLFYHRGDLNLLALGEGEARHLGLDVARVRRRLLAAASLMTAAAVSLSGIIGFVGLVVPHLVRLAVGPDHRYLLPISFFLGGAALALADTLARTVISPSEVPVGVVTAMLGGPFFAYLLRRRRRSG